MLTFPDLRDLKRLVVINDSSVPKGGATQLAVQLAGAVSAQGVAVTFVTGDDGESDQLRHAGVDIIPLGGERLLASKKALIDGLHNAAAYRLLTDVIRDLDGPGVVYHVHGWAQVFSPSIFDALASVADRTILTAHDFFLTCPNGVYTIFPTSEVCSLKPMSIQCIKTHCDKKSYAHKIWRMARQSILNSKLYVGPFPYRVVVIQDGMIPLLARGGVPESSIVIISNPSAEHFEKRVLAEENAQILFVGRITKDKGVDLLATAAERLGVSVRFVGAGDAEDDVRKISPNARLDGWSTQEEIAQAMKEARFLVMPSRCLESFGLVAAEALKAGVPVLTSRSSLIGEAIEAHGMGARCNVDDLDEFAGVLKDWLADDAKVKAMSLAAKTSASVISQSERDWVNAHLALFEETARRL